MIEEFKVELEDSQRIYFSGDDLRGHIILHVKAPYDLKCVAIRFVGEAKFRLPEESLYEKMNLKRKRKQLKNTLKKIRRKNKICPAPITNEDTKAAAGEEKNNVKMKKKRLMRFSSETYFDKRDILFGHNYSSYREHLPAGTHCLPFAFTLPANLPTSYVGRRAFIHYYCEALIERWNKPSVAQKTHFTVSEVVDLNNDPRADMSCSVTKNSSCWLLCCPRGTILVTGRLTHQGVVCGQAVPLEADIHNMTNSNINQSYLSIIQVTSYLNSHGIAVCEDERLVLQVKNGRIPKGEFVIWPENKMMKVPPLPPTSQSRTLCKIIVISYRVQIRLKLSMKGDSVTVNLPLIIGNIPFRKDFKNLKYDGDENQLHNRLIFAKSNTKSRLLKQLRVNCIPQFAKKSRVKCIPQFAKDTPYSIAGVPCDNPKQTECSYPLPDHVPKCMTFKFSD